MEEQEHNPARHEAERRLWPAHGCSAKWTNGGNEHHPRANQEQGDEWQRLQSVEVAGDQVRGARATVWHTPLAQRSRHGRVTVSNLPKLCASTPTCSWARSLL